MEASAEDIRRWLSLCRAARKLPARHWETWTFIVGTGGTPADRTRIGAAVLPAFGRTWEYHHIEGSSDE